MRRGERIAEALARHPEKGDVLLPLLHRRYKGYEKDLMEWLESLLIEVAGRMRLEEAIPILVERLLEDDGRVRDSCATALQWIGGDRVVQAISQQWPAAGEDFRQTASEILEFFQRHRVRSVVATESNMGCPHEEGIDFPEGGDCPFCPFWKGKQGSGAKE